MCLFEPSRSSVLLTIVVAIAAAPLGACGLGSAPPFVVSDLPSERQRSSKPDDPAAGGAGGLASVEVCDGWDNDGDGLADEALGGEPCITDVGAAGTMQCTSGRSSCESCNPGDSRRVPCACGTDRIDVCTAWGTWMTGTCDGCQAPPRLCQCTPGEHEVRRCDSCSGQDCGTTCIGATWVCRADCQWEQSGSCAPLSPQCSTDQSAVQPCGNCGVRKLTCDGCFWQTEPCKQQGECSPSETRTVPCFKEECQQGMVAEISCDSSCHWSSPTECRGCAIGQVNETTDPCVPGHACGLRRHQTVCIASQMVATCGGTQTLVEGYLSQVEIDECHIECMPGQTEACTTSSGEAGTRDRGCRDNCTLGAPGECVANVGSCVPGTHDDYTYNCGCGHQATVERVCRATGDGYDTTGTDTSDCPECAAGQQHHVACTAAGGRCGYRLQTCTNSCTWGPLGACEPNPWSCVPGTVENEQVSCGAGTCGRTFTRTKTCRSDGCGWTTVDDRSTCPSCAPGSTQQQSCTINGRCGVRTNTCSATTCEWTGFGACEPLPESCTPGSQTVSSASCGANTCGATYSIIRTCRSDGCGWMESEDRSTCPPCHAGTVEDTSIPCVPGVPQCGFKQRQCTSSCQWIDLTCPPCG